MRRTMRRGARVMMDQHRDDGQSGPNSTAVLAFVLFLSLTCSSIAGFCDDLRIRPDGRQSATLVASLIPSPVFAFLHHHQLVTRRTTVGFVYHGLQVHLSLLVLGELEVCVFCHHAVAIRTTETVAFIDSFLILLLVRPSYQGAMARVVFVRPLFRAAS